MLYGPSSAYIPPNKFSNPDFNEFLIKYTSEIISKLSTLRKGYVDKCCDETLKEIKKIVSGKRFRYTLTRRNAWMHGLLRLLSLNTASG